MKATLPRSMGRFAVLALPLALTLASGCSERQAAPAPTPAPTPAPAPPPPPPAPKVDWRDAKITLGDWSWGMVGGRSTASFAGGAFTMQCDRNAGTVTLSRRGIAEGRVPMTVLTQATTRDVAGTGTKGPPPAIVVTLPARDPLLDAMAFSRGRFAVEVAGLQTLYIPSWPEVSRVIEDCR